jgi:hypothetical protein
MTGSGGGSASGPGNPQSSDYIIFADESGDHGLDFIDPGYPAFVLAFCVIDKATYAHQLLPTITEFKFRHFGHDQVVLHERDIRKDTGDFSFLKDRARKEEFLGELSSIIAATEMTILASVIRKDLLAGRYWHPDNPYELALGFGLERASRCLNRRQATGTTTVVLERRGRQEDDALELEFRRVSSGQNYLKVPLPLEPRFVSKAANVPGLQLADLVARPIGRHVLDPSQPNRAFDIIEKKLDRSPAGEVKGWGLKVFP